ncbi:MAG: class I SAM-dependent methyltransferase [Oscillospiraceae bacterium]
MGGEMYRAGLPMPGARLLEAAKLVRPGRVVADIGCDHGKLAVYLAKSGRVAKVIAVDKRPIPLSHAKALVLQTGVGRLVDCRLGDGFAPLGPGEAEEIVIAGVSGETIVQIVSGAEWARGKNLHFVFVPATRAWFLRKWLCENGFVIEREVPVEENARFYTVLSVFYTGERAPGPTPLFCEVGLVPRSAASAAKGYIGKRAEHLKKRLLAPMEQGERAALEQLLKEVEQCLR